MAKKNKDNRYELNLQEQFVDKLSFENNILKFGSSTKITELAELLGKDKNELLKLIEAEANTVVLDDEQVAEIALNLEFEYEKVEDISEVNVLSKLAHIYKNFDWPEEAEVKRKPPVITIMGHVDHGKTTLLDTIKKTNVTASEAGGITQSIGAYQVEVKDQKLTFIDTPGHEAFSKMRSNGVDVTDIIIIIVAADDSVKPQTIESIELAKASGAPIIVAVNKMDAPGADIEKVKTDLVDHGLTAEDWGGDVPFMPISALNGDGVDLLLDTIILQSEMIELETPHNTNAFGTVIETNVDKKRGSLVSVIVKSGTLKKGDLIMLDGEVASVKNMFNDKGEAVSEALPGMPVEIYGLGFAPEVGKNFLVANDKNLHKIASIQKQVKLNKQRRVEEVDPFAMFDAISSSKKELNFILKTDTVGVMHAIKPKIEALSTDEVDVKVVKASVGDITSTEMDVAVSSGARFITFNAKPSASTQTQLKGRSLDYTDYDIIYRIFEDVEKQVALMQDEKFEEEFIGTAEVLQTFEFSKLGVIAGCIVRDGSVKRNSVVKVIRGGETIHEGKIQSLKFEKDDIKEVIKGRECGIVIEDFNDIQEGDTIEAYELVKV